MTDEIDADPEALARAIREGDESAPLTLYRVMRTRFARALGRFGAADFDDHLHDTFVVVVEALRTNTLRDPGALYGYIHAVIRLRGYRGIRERVRARQASRLEYIVETLPGRGRNPELELIAGERMRCGSRILLSLRDRDREILVRFYLKGESREAICAAMDLTGTQLRLMKSRAKARLAKKTAQAVE
jgi:RNA polymerase sigma factor (sigma-70 family)